jgi:hypothetical protein
MVETSGDDSTPENGDQEAPPIPEAQGDPVEPDLTPIQGAPSTAGEDVPEEITIVEPDLSPIKGDSSTRLDEPPPSETGHNSDES